MAHETTLTVNGKAHPHTDSMTVASLLACVHKGQGVVVVEVNGMIVAPEKREETSLHSGDAVEIIQFVGGG